MGNNQKKIYENLKTFFEILCKINLLSSVPSETLCESDQVCINFFVSPHRTEHAALT